MKTNKAKGNLVHLALSVLVLFLTLTIPGACSNENSGSATSTSIRFPTEDEELYEPEIFVMHAESASVSDNGDGTFRFTLNNLDPDTVHFEDHPSKESGTVYTHDVILRWIEYRDEAKLVTLPLPPGARQDINLHITFHDPETDQRYSSVVHMHDLVNYTESPSELMIDGALGAGNSETALLAGKLYTNVTVVIDSIFDVIWSCGRDALTVAECIGCPEEGLSCAGCVAGIGDILKEGDECSEAYCGVFMPNTSVHDCRMWMLCMTTATVNPAQCFF